MGKHDTERSKEFPTQCSCGGDLRVVEPVRLLPDDFTDCRGLSAVVKCSKCGAKRKLRPFSK